MVSLGRMMRVGMVCGVQALALASMAQTATQTAVATTRLSGLSEVPPVASGGSGTLEAVLNKETRVLTWTISYSDLSGPVTAGHFHGPAMPGSNAAVAVPVEGASSSPARGSATLTAAQMADLVSGSWYVNLHTAAHPDGEIRGQVMVAP